MMMMIREDIEYFVWSPQFENPVFLSVKVFGNPVHPLSSVIQEVAFFISILEHCQNMVVINTTFRFQKMRVKKISS